MRLLLMLLTFVAGARAASGDLAFVGATVFPSPDAVPLHDAVIVVSGGHIAALGPRRAVSVPADARVIDCTGRFITAGFWNCHVHILTPDLLNVRQTPTAQLEASLEGMFSRWGFTTVFDIASGLENTLALRDRIERGEVRGPRVLTTGEPIWTETPIYVREYLVANRIIVPPARTQEEAIARVQALAGRGVDGVKLFTGSVQARGAVANMTADLVRAAVTEAHRRRLPVFSHPQNSAGLEAALAGGVDILAHPAPQSPAWTPEFARRLQQAGIALIPTLTLFRVEGQKAQVPAAEIQRWLDHAIGQLRVFRAARGEILFGTDIGYIDHFDTAEEYQLLARAGLDFPALLTTLTTAPAARFGAAERSGRLAQGFAADLVVLDSDPRKDVTALARVHATLRQGKFLYRKE